MVNMLRLLALQFLLCFVSAANAANTGSVSGTVYDEQSGEKLVGANLVVVGTTRGAATDLDGKYTITGISAGTHTLRVSLLGYATKTITGVVVHTDQTLKLDVALKVEEILGEEVIVTAERVLATEAALLAERKNASTIGDGISAEQVKRTPDATSGEALRRVTGLSLVDNKFVFIRGITDRYNGTTLDGASVGSTEAGKKSFSFDLVPANLLENTVVVKSARPDLPGDFTGGLVQLNTLEFPDRFTARLNVSGSYNSLTTSRELSASRGNPTNWLGFDDGSRDFPTDNADPIQLAQSMKNTWAPTRHRAPMNSGFSLAIGNQYIMNEEHPGHGQIGLIGALSYRNSYQRNERLLNDRDQSRVATGSRDDYSVLWGGIANLTYKFAGLHKISFKNSYNHTAEDQASQFSLDDSSTYLKNQVTILNYTQRSIYNGQLLGDHSFPSLGGLELSWRATVSSSARMDPDRKEASYYRDLFDPEQMYTAGYNKRSWSHVNDRTTSFAVDFTIPISDVRVKWGAMTEHKTSDYGIRYFRGAADYFHGASDSLTQLPLESIYSPENYGTGKFLFSEISQPSDSYLGDQILYAGYVMTDIPFDFFSQRFRFAGGARLENWVQTVSIPKARTADSEYDRDRVKRIDILPSMNLTYQFNPVTNLRLAYSHSVNRPEFRERARTIYEDFVTNTLYGGNPDLQRAYVHNYDVRFEVFPQAGELLAVSYFQKHISGAIEEELIFSGTRSMRFFNSGFARNSGWELEFRKSLSFLGEYFGNFMVSGNYTRIESRVEYETVEGNSSNTRTVLATRPMQGQSPYMINLSVLFTEPTFGTALSVSYNKAGRRLQTVGFLSSDIYEEPRDLVDIAVSQPLFGRMEAKFTIKNLNGKDRALTRDEFLYERTATGTTYGLQMSYSL